MSHSRSTLSQGFTAILLLLFSLLSIHGQEAPVITVLYSENPEEIGTSFEAKILQIADTDATGPDVNLSAQFTPDGWDAPLVVSSIPGTRTDGPDLTAGVDCYIDLAFFNTGTNDMSSSFSVDLLRDSLIRIRWGISALNANAGVAISDVVRNIAEGEHSFSFIVDSQSGITETDENDNQYSKLTSDEALQHYRDQDMPYILLHWNLAITSVIIY